MEEARCHLRQGLLTGLSVYLHRRAGPAHRKWRNWPAARTGAVWQQRRTAARKGLSQLTTDEGYFINSLDPDARGTVSSGRRNTRYSRVRRTHDAIAFRVADDAQARRIFAKIASIPGLRPHQFIIPNTVYDDITSGRRACGPSGTWVNGGHWSTCEARMMLGYYRLGQFEDARRSMRQMLTFAERFRMDNPLVKFGSDVLPTGPAD